MSSLGARARITLAHVASLSLITLVGTACGGSSDDPPDAGGNSSVDACTRCAGDGAVRDARTLDASGLPGPIVTAINRHGVPPEGGPSVLFIGKNFVPPASVFFGDVASSTVTVLSATQLTAVAPAHAVGPVDLTVANRDGQFAVVTGQFEFAPAPVLTGIAPTSGPHEGGTQVVISGSDLRVVQVLFSGHVAVIVGVPTATSVTVTTPAMEAGMATISVVNSDGQGATLDGTFTAQ